MMQEQHGVMCRAQYIMVYMVVISYLHLWSGNQQYNVSTLFVGQRSHCLLSVLYILAINLKKTNMIIKHFLKTNLTQPSKHFNPHIEAYLYFPNLVTLYNHTSCFQGKL